MTLSRKVIKRSVSVKELYVEKRFSKKSLAIIEIADAIVKDYAAQGYDLTLRQLYYQFVSKDIIPNHQKFYNMLGSVINDARLAGLIDWDRIVDRTRHLRKNAHWESVEDILKDVHSQFRIDKWDNQKVRPEVWIEKDALVGVIESVCREFDVGYFSCRGYVSQSEMWSAGKRFSGYRDRGQVPFIVHLGDHDPSGIDMTRDIQERMTLFVGVPVEVVRIALTRKQVDEVKPPPNFAKQTDSRFKDYVSVHGEDSWELDALDPKYIDRIIRSTIMRVRDEDKWDEAVLIENEHKNKIAEFIADSKKKKGIIKCMK